MAYENNFFRVVANDAGVYISNTEIMEGGESNLSCDIVFVFYF